MKAAHRQSRRRIVAWAATALFVAGAATAQRPNKISQSAKQTERVVFRAFPEADAYRCIHRDITQPHRVQIEKRLPFKVHFDELGEHRLLVAFRGRRPVGLVYQRTEEAEWGLTEIAWHLALDRRVVGFKILRSRNRHIKSLERSQLATHIAGRSFEGVIEMLNSHEKADQRKRDPSLVSIERTTIRSAAKALAVVEFAWQSQVENLNDQATGFDLFPAAARFRRGTKTIAVEQGETKQPFNAKVLYAYDGGNTFLGCVAWTRQERTGPKKDEQPPPMSLRWTISRDLIVIAAQPTNARPSRVLRKACSELKGHPLSKPSAASEHLAPLARSLGTLILQLSNGSIRR